MKKAKKALLLTLAASFFINISAIAGNINTFSDDALYSFDFGDGTLPEIFGSDVFGVENGRLKITSSKSKVTFSDVPKNSSIELKIKTDGNSAIPKFNAELGKEKDRLSDELISQYSEKYQARQADTRMVRNQGKSEKN